MHLPHRMQSLDEPMSASLAIPMGQASKQSKHSVHSAGLREMVSTENRLKIPIVPKGHR